MPGWMVCTKYSHELCSRSLPARISALLKNSAAPGIRHTPSGMNSVANRSKSPIIAESVNSPRSASISTRSAMA